MARSRCAVELNLRKICLTLIALTLPWGQAPSLPAQDLDLVHYTVESGLPAAQVHDIAQHRDGHLWVATVAGLVSFDGREFRTWGLGEGLGWADQAAVTVDSHGNLWSVAREAPFLVSLLRQDRFESLPLPPRAITDRLQGASIHALEVICRSEPEPDTLDGTEVVVATDRGLLIFEGGTWKVLGRKEGLPEGEIRDLAHWQDRLAIATAGGLILYRGGKLDRSLDRRLDQLPDKEVVALASARSRGDFAVDRVLWLVGRSWVARLSDQELRLVATDLDFAGRISASGLTEPRIDATVDGLGGLYLALQGRLVFFHPERGMEVLGSELGIGVGQVSSVFLGREMELWVGGDLGLAKLTSRQLITWRGHHGLFADEVTAAVERRNGSLAFGHRGGLSILRDGRMQSQALPLESADGGRLERVRDLSEDASGALWIAAESRGVARFSPAGALQWFGPGQGVVGDANAILAHDGEVWVGTDTGLLRRVGGRFVAQAGNPDAKIRRIVAAKDGALLLATGSGLWRYQPVDRPADRPAVAPSGETERWRQWSCDDPRCNSVFTVLDEGDLWVGTAAGLFRIFPDTEALQPVHPELIDQPVFFVVREGERLWIGTDDGVVRFVPDSDSPIERLTVEDGLAGRQTVRTAALVDRRGQLFIGTDRGVSVYDRRYDVSNRPPPTLEILTVRASGEELELTGPVHLAPDSKEMRFRFSSISMVEEDRLRFYSRLEGVESEWQGPFAAEERQIRYSPLQPGEYRLHLRVVGNNDREGVRASSPPITIAVPFWQRPWFFVIVGAFLLAGLLWIQSYISQRHHSRNLEKEVARRMAELQASEDRYRKTFRTIDDGVITTDGEGRVELLNPQAERITGWVEKDAVGQPVEEVLRFFQIESSGEAGAPLALLSGNLQDTIGPTQTALLMTGDERTLTVEVTATPIVSRGVGFTGLVFAFRDISSRREVEAELARAQKLEAVGILAGGIAHDFNNLLTVLLGNLSLIRENPNLGDAEREGLRDAENALVRARDLTQQLLTFSRGGAPVRRAASIDEVIRDSASFVLSGSKIRNQVELEEGLWVVEVDPGQISQVLQNLLLNASQAMPGGGRIRVRARNSRHAPQPLGKGRWVRIDVRDTGIGIPENLVDRIFEPYFSTKHEGRGLGLASAYSIIKKHDGLLTVDSAVGQGTTFTVYLPASKELRPMQSPSRASSFRSHGRVLVMDDDPMVRRTSGAMLERLGFEVTFTSDGREAIDRYAEAKAAGKPFRAVMMDLTVPGGMGGQDAVGRLRQVDPGVVAIVYSGYSTDPVLARYREYGFSGRLSKPFRLNDLRAVFEEALGPDGERGGAASGVEEQAG